MHIYTCTHPCVHIHIHMHAIQVLACKYTYVHTNKPRSSHDYSLMLLCMYSWTTMCLYTYELTHVLTCIHSCTQNIHVLPCTQFIHTLMHICSFLNSLTRLFMNSHSCIHMFTCILIQVDTHKHVCECLSTRAPHTDTCIHMKVLLLTWTHIYMQTLVLRCIHAHLCSHIYTYTIHALTSIENCNTHAHLQILNILKHTLVHIWLSYSQIYAHTCAHTHVILYTC